jgi:hypothetical protein
MKFEQPIPESKVPERKSMPPARYLELYEAVMKLAPGSVLPVAFEDKREASKLAASLQHSKFAAFHVAQRDNKVYVRLRNENDDKQAAHIKELREKARSRKTETSHQAHQ